MRRVKGRNENERSYEYFIVRDSYSFSMTKGLRVCRVDAACML